MKIMNSMRAVASTPGLSKVLLHPWVRKTAANIASVRFLRAGFVTTSPARLIASEALHRGSVRRYTVRSSSVPVVMQHGRDLEALSELFVSQEYEPPVDLVERLSAPGLCILDIGANVGMFSAWATGRFAGCTITAFEPSEENLPVMRRWIREASSTAQLVPACAMTQDGPVRFSEGTGAGAHLAAADEQAAAVVHDGVDIYPYLADADFVKMDIEGGEWSILGDERLKEIGRLTIIMEYHRYLAPSLPARDAAVQLLTEAGFETGFGDSNFWGHGTLWAWKG